MAFTHTPYDGTKQPFTIGAEPLAPADWIEPDAALAADLALKDALLRTRYDDVARFSDDSTAAQQEVLSLLASHLPACFPHLYRAEGGDALTIVPAGRQVRLREASEPSLVTSARLVQEDICLMRRDAAGWRLVAGVLCFPSGWSLAEKIGGDLAAIHGPVPGFAGRMEETVTRMFDRLTPGRPLVRWNWSIYGDDALRQEASELATWKRFPTAQALQQAHLRIERQTVRRLPESGDILFTIRIHHDPLSALSAHPQRAKLAGGLRLQLLALDEAQLAYKGLAPVRDELAALLAGLAA